MQDEFRPIVENATSECKDYFCQRLVASYLHGSILYGDAVKGVSDLDYFIIIEGPLSEIDRKWLSRTEARLQQKYDGLINGIHLSTYSIDDLKNDAFTRFALKHNAALQTGHDVAAAIDSSASEKYMPDKKLAKARLNFAKECFHDALHHQTPACTGELPENTFYAARKFARYFVVIEGAYFLMSKGKFHTFDKDGVLAQLSEEVDPRFTDVLDLSSVVLHNPLKTGIPHELFIVRIRPLVEWMFDEISKS